MVYPDSDLYPRQPQLQPTAVTRRDEMYTCRLIYTLGSNGTYVTVKCPDLDEPLVLDNPPLYRPKEGKYFTYVVIAYVVYAIPKVKIPNKTVFGFVGGNFTSPNTMSMFSVIMHNMKYNGVSTKVPQSSYEDGHKILLTSYGTTINGYDPAKTITSFTSASFTQGNFEMEWEYSKSLKQIKYNVVQNVNFGSIGSYPIRTTYFYGGQP